MSKIEREQFDAIWMSKGESMLNRKRSQEVKKTPCLCEKAMAGSRVEGDRLCGGPEIVLEMRESKAQEERQSEPKNELPAARNIDC